MTAQLSRERLEEKLLEHIKHGGDSEEETMIRMLLAGMDSEPFGFVRNVDNFSVMSISKTPMCDVGVDKPLYTAPPAPAPVAVPDEITWEDAPSESLGYAYGWNACRAAMLKAGHVTAATVPEGRVAKAILHACECFLLGCSVDTKNYENYFYDEETGISFTIYELAEKLGIVNCIGNRCWSLHPKVRDEINQVYRKYALLMLAAAPAAHEPISGTYKVKQVSSNEPLIGATICPVCHGETKSMPFSEIKYCPVCNPDYPQKNSVMDCGGKK